MRGAGGGCRGVKRVIEERSQGGVNQQRDKGEREEGEEGGEGSRE